MSSLPRFLSDGLLGNLVGSSPPTKSTQNVAAVGMSRGFEIFIQTVNRKQSKYEEDQVIQRELQTIQQNLATPGTSMFQKRDYLCRIVYCHLLGHDVSWSYIHALQLAQQGSHMDKQIGYLACCLLLHRDHELTVLLMNTIMKDLHSSNILDNMAALSAASQLVPKDVIPTVLPQVIDKLRHQRELVRQKAVMCLYQFQLLAPELLDHNEADLQRALFDKDPGVMATAVHIVHNNIQRCADKHVSVGESLISILRQIVSRKLASMFDYHSIPSPWLQIHIIRCLAKLAAVHPTLRSSLCPLLKDILQRTSIKENMAFAILYECIVCIVAIQPDRQLLDEAAQHVARFIRSNDPNLKYIGVKALVSLVQVNRQFAMEYQSLIVQSLENTDQSVQRKMYKLLYEIANVSNVEAVTSKLLLQLSVTMEKHWRSEVITMVIQLVQRFHDKPEWRIEMLLSCVQLGGTDIDHNIINTVLALLQSDLIHDGVDQKCQYYLVQKCVTYLLQVTTSTAVIQIAAWVLGELCPLLKSMPEDRVISLFTKHLCNPDLPYCVKTSLICALQKVAVQHVVKCVTMVTCLQECLHKQHCIVIKQMLSVLLGVCRQEVQVHHHDNMEDIDTTLSFLDDHVSDHIEAGDMPYTPEHLRGMSQVCEPEASVYPVSHVPDDVISSDSRVRTASSTSSSKLIDDSESGIKLTGVKQVWGRHGRLDTGVSTAHVQDTAHQATVLTDEERKQQELTSALFSGFQSEPKDGVLSSADNGGFSQPGTDTGGWRSLHSTLTQGQPPLLDNTVTAVSRGTAVDNVLIETQVTNIENSQELDTQNSLGNSSFYSQGETSTFQNSNVEDPNLNLSKDHPLTIENGANMPVSNPTNENASLSTNQMASKPANEDADVSTNEELDEALSMLLSDNSSFLNISVSSNDQSRMSISRLGGESFSLNPSSVSTIDHNVDQILSSEQNPVWSDDHNNSAIPSNELGFEIKHENDSGKCVDPEGTTQGTLYDEQDEISIYTEDS